jgi:hypothetical protein
MTTIFEGRPLADITTTTSATTPSWYDNTVTAGTNIAQNQMKKTAAEGLAGQDPLQLQGYSATAGAANSYLPGLNAAQYTAGQAGNAMNAAGIQQFMNPYINNVTNEQARLANQNFQRNVLPALGGQFVGTGGFGGQRFASALGQAGADFQANLTGQQNKSLADAYSSALTGAYNQGNLLNNAAQTQGALAGKQQEYGLKGASALTAAGAAQNAYNQSVLDYPLTNALNSMKVLSGLTIPQGKVEKGPKTKDYYGNSTLANVQATYGLFKSAQEGKYGDTVKDAINKFLNGDNSGFKNLTQADINALYNDATPEARRILAQSFEEDYPVQARYSDLYAPPPSSSGGTDTTTGGGGTDTLTGGGGNDTTGGGSEEDYYTGSGEGGDN